jgi:predicted CxxxxCH...CXXCH cytochrome family protein
MLAILLFSAGIANAGAVITQCNDCHGMPPRDAAVRTSNPNFQSGVSATIGNHQNHLPVAAINTQCVNCHGTMVTATDHQDDVINMAASGAIKGGSYTKGIFFNQTSIPVLTHATCSSVSCHFETTTPTWGTSATTTSCASCHQASPTTFAHPKHTVFTACVTCHSSHTTFDHATSAGRPISVVVGSYAGSNSNYLPSQSTGRTLGSCSTAYCHSSGNVNNAGTAVAPTTFKTIAWDAASIGCSGCHGDSTVNKVHPTYASGAPASATANSHVKHVESSSYSCDYCHINTTTDTTIPPTSVLAGVTHLNSIVDVAFKTNAGLTGTYSAVGKTCSATYCHGTGPSVAWGGTVTCASCHDANSTLMVRHDKHYGSATVATVLAGGTDAHTATTYVFSCMACHPSNQHATGPASATAPLQDAAVSGTKITAYTKGSASTTDLRGFNYTTNGTCSTLCHTKDGATAASAVVPQNWGTAATGSCGVCHSKAGDASPTWSAPHSKHINSYTANTNITCAACHAGTATSNSTINGISGRNQHPNTVKDVAMNAFATGGTVLIAGAQGAQTCANTYCHSNGSSATGTHTAVSWSGTFSTCAECHGNATTIASGSHSKHITLAGVSCASCHNATVSGNTTIANAANHVNKSVTINFAASAAPAGGTYNTFAAGGASVYQKPVGTAAGGCSTTTCHGGNSGVWGAANADAPCVKCHGVVGTSAAVYTATPNTAAPGFNGTGVNTTGTVGTITGGVSTDTKVGAHDAHLKGSGGYKLGGVTCADCHAVSALGDAGHMDGTTTMTWSNLAKNVGTTPYNADIGALVPAYTAPSCSTNYCHGGGFAAAVKGTGTTISWTDGSYLANAGSAMNTIDCNRCHQSPPISSTKNNHAGVTLAGIGSCSGCHSHDGYGDARHINGTLEASGGACNGCHSYDTVGGVWGSGTHKDGVQAAGWGAHAQHIDHLKTRLAVTLDPNADSYGNVVFKQICGACHSSSLSDHSMGNANARNINFDNRTTYRSGAVTRPFYNGSSASTTKLKTCANVSCHFTTTPQWQ